MPYNIHYRAADIGGSRIVDDHVPAPFEAVVILSLVVI